MPGRRGDGRLLTVVPRRDVAALARAARTPGLHRLNLLRGTMLGYPDNNDKTHHPDLVTLAAACERAGADLRVVVLSRAPEPIVASTAVPQVGRAERRTSSRS